MMNFFREELVAFSTLSTNLKCLSGTWECAAKFISTKKTQITTLMMRRVKGFSLIRASICRPMPIKNNETFSVHPLWRRSGLPRLSQTDFIIIGGAGYFQINKADLFIHVTILYGIFLV